MSGEAFAIKPMKYVVRAVWERASQPFANKRSEIWILACFAKICTCENYPLYRIIYLACMHAQYVAVTYSVNVTSVVDVLGEDTITI